MSEDARMPPGIQNAYAFALFNALSFQMVLAGPMVLFAKSLGASSTILGLVAGLMPIMTIAQIPAAQFIPSIGYKRFVLGGWSTRVAFIFLMALVPLTGGFLNAGSRLALIIALLFAFNLSRGLSSCAWLPWITHLVPTAVRARYLTIDQLCNNGASIAAFIFAAFMLGDAADAWQFTVVFLFSGAAGFVSLLFLRRIPDVAVSEEQDGGRGPIPWGAMANHPPFRRLLEMNAAWSIAYGGLTTFIVSYLKSSADFGERRVLLVMSLSFVGGLASYWVAGQRVDRLGSKPVLGFTMAAGALGTLGWGLVAGGLLPATTGSTLGLAFLVGLCNALFSVANNRLAMSLVPVMGRNHFFALFAVVWQLTLGVSPILWGILLDAVGGHRSNVLGLEWNRFSLFFFLATAAFGIAFLMTRRLDEPRAAGAHAMLHELLIQHPQKLLVRLFVR